MGGYSGRNAAFPEARLVDFLRFHALKSTIVFRYHLAIMLRDFFLGFIGIHVLYHASREPIYGLWLIEELGRHGYRLSPGTLYPILHNLEEKGHLKSFEKKHNGRVRKYYRTTPRGDRMLSESKERIGALMDEVME
jgi:PadR family transcriptional regulator PadR